MTRLSTPLGVLSAIISPIVHLATVLILLVIIAAVASFIAVGRIIRWARKTRLKLVGW